MPSEAPAHSILSALGSVNNEATERESPEAIVGAKLQSGSWKHESESVNTAGPDRAPPHLRACPKPRNGQNDRLVSDVQYSTVRLDHAQRI